MKVVVLAGGRSSEHSVSLDSARSVLAGLERAGHEAREVVIGRDGVWKESGTGDPLSIVPGRGLLDADVVFPVLHGPFGEDQESAVARIRAEGLIAIVRERASS